MKRLAEMASNKSCIYIHIFPNGKRFITVKAASLATGIRQDTIGKMCKGELKEKNGFVFCYADEKVAEEQTNEG